MLCYVGIYGLSIFIRGLFYLQYLGQSMSIAPVVNNVIGVGQLSNPNTLDLNLIASKVEGSRLNTRKFPGLVLRKTKPKGTILLFRSNKFVIVGTESEQNCQTLSKKLAKDLQKITNAKSMEVKDFRISNIVASGHLGFRVGISRIAQLPNAFKDDKSSGVFIRLSKVKCVIVFQSGKIVLNGATQVKDIDEVFQNLCGQLHKYRLDEEEQEIKREYAEKAEKRKSKKQRKQEKREQKQKQADSRNIHPPSQTSMKEQQQKKLKHEDESNTAEYNEVHRGRNERNKDLQQHSQNDSIYDQ